MIGVGHLLGSRSERVAAIGISLVHADARSEGRLPRREQTGQTPSLLTERPIITRKGSLMPQRKRRHAGALSIPVSSCHPDTRGSGCRLGRLFGRGAVRKGVTQRLLVEGGAKHCAADTLEIR
jgi:hypothetical protein